MGYRGKLDWTDEEYEDWFYGQCVTDEDGCLVYKGRPSEVQCRLRYKGRSLQVHQIGFILFNGSLPRPPLQINHRCNKHNCVHPACLYAGTPHENNQDLIESGNWKGNKYQQGLAPHNSIGTKRTPEQRARIAAGVRAANERRGAGR